MCFSSIPRAGGVRAANGRTWCNVHFSIDNDAQYILILGLPRNVAILSGVLEPIKILREIHIDVNVFRQLLIVSSTVGVPERLELFERAEVLWEGIAPVR